MRRYPVDNRIVIPGLIPFGGADPNAKFGRHAGDDSANAVGTPVYAMDSGLVGPYIGGDDTYQGRTIEIFNGKDYPHVFHLQSRLVAPGQQVTAGQLIGYSGATGLGITGPHVHFGVSKVSVGNTTSFNDYKDPLEWVKEEEDNVIIQDERTARALLWYNGWTDEEINAANPIPDMIGRDFVAWSDRLKQAPDDNPHKVHIARAVYYVADVKKAAEGAGYEKVGTINSQDLFAHK